jgi:hypothetical protein
MSTGIRDLVFTALHRAWEESFVERYRLWAVRVVGIEITQAIQHYRAGAHLTDPADRGMDNTVDLVAYKAAWVRVYVRAGLQDWVANVTATLELARRNYAMQYETIRSFTPQAPVTAHRTLGYRDERNQTWRSLNFVIPASELHGRLRFTARITGHDDHAHAVEVNVPLVQTLRVRVFPITYDGPSTANPTPAMPATPLTLAAPTLADAQATASRAFAAMPVQATGSFAIASNMSWFTALDDARTEDGGCSNNWNALLGWLSLLRDNDGNRNDVVYYGLLPAGMPVNVPGCGDEGLGAGAVGDQTTFLHEIGHAYDFEHTPCGAVGSRVDNNYPEYEPYPRTSIGEFGLDMRNGQVFDPQTTFDYMSYCPAPQWISLYQHQRLLQHPRLDPQWLPDRTVFDDHGAQQRPFDLEHLWWPDPPWFLDNLRRHARSVIAVQGTVHEGGRIEVDSVARITVFAPARGRPTHWSAQLLDERGGVLARAPLMRRELRGGGCGCDRGAGADPDAAPFPFRVYLPDVAPGASLRIRDPKDEPRWTREAEGEPPRFASVAATADAGRGLRLEWRLESSGLQDVWVQWRRPREDAWHGLAVGLRESPAQLPLAGLPAGDVELRLIAHDGFHSTTSDPVPVVLPEQPPVLAILSPTEGARVRAGVPFLLQGSLTDSAGQPLRDAHLTWSLDGMPAGSGRGCWVTHDPGIVLVTLQAFLADELIARKSVRITVEGHGRVADCD